MFKRKSLFVILTAIMMLVLISGCTGSKSTKDTLSDALKKSSEIKSYSLKGSLNLADLKLPEAATSEDGTAQVIGLLKNAELSWTGGYRQDPMLMELNLQVAIKGDLAMTFTLPIIMTKEKLWIKIPNIPMLGLPTEIVGKYIEMDLKKLAEQQGQELPNMDIGNSQKLVSDVSGILFKHIDEKTYLSDVSVKDSGITATDVKKVVQLHVTKDQVEPFVQTVVKDIAPEIIDLLSKNEEYRKLLNVKQEDLDTAKKQLAESKDTEIAKALEDFKKSVKSMDVKSNMGINNDGYISYTDATISADIDDNGEAGSGTLHIVTEMTDINGDVKLSGEPKAEEVLTDEQMSQLGLSGFTGQ